MTLVKISDIQRFFRAHLAVSCPLQDFYLPHLTKDCIYHKGDNSFFLQFLGRAASQSSPK